MNNKKEKTVVYAIKVNGIVRYIGSGVFGSRKSNHLSRFRENIHCPELQKLFNKYGEEAFEFEKLERCAVKDCFDLENKYMKIHKDTILNENGIKNTKKSVKTGLKAKKHKELFKEIMSGENNPHCTKLNAQKVFEILDMIVNGIDRKTVANKYNISPNYISRIGKDRWINEFNEWENEKVASIDVDTTLISAIAFAQ